MNLRKKIIFMVAAMSMGASVSAFALVGVGSTCGGGVGTTVGPTSCETGTLFCAPFGPTGNDNSCSVIVCSCVENQQ